MTVTLATLERWFLASEDEHLEFKEARNRFDVEELTRYCGALANEGGGHVVLGVTDVRPRIVVGTSAFEDVNRLKSGLMERVTLRIDVTELAHPAGRVLVVSVPSRHLGVPILVRGAAWMRRGEDLVPMTPDLMRRIFEETGLDYSAEICGDASMADLDHRAIEEFRRRWSLKSGRPTMNEESPEQVLTDAELLVEGRVTYAALMLFGSAPSMSRFLPQAEVVFEYRSSDASGPAAQRLDLREGFLLVHDRLWEAINLRNDLQSIQDGLFMRHIATFNEIAVREVIANAVSHRDYRLPGSVFVRQFPRRLEVTSPGGLPNGVTLENILWTQAPRNRRLAEALARCDLIERSGQGVNRMFEESIKEGKPRPSFEGTDAHQVHVTLTGEVRNPAFLRFLERVGSERVASFHTRDLMLLDCIARDEPISVDLIGRKDALIADGIIERVGRGRGQRFILARRLYEFLGQPGTYTRKRGLDRETQKELLLRHLRDRREVGSPLSELSQVLPEISRGQLQYLLGELRDEGRAQMRGRSRGARWYAEVKPKVDDGVTSLPVAE